MIQKKLTIFVVVISLLLCLTGCNEASNQSSKQTAEQVTQSTTVPDKKDNFYQAVNADQLNQWTIPDDQASISWFDNASEDVYQKIDQLIQQLVTKDNPVSSDAYNIAALYETGMDQDSRNNGKYGIMNDYLSRIDSATSVEQLLSINMEMNRKTGFSSLMGVLIYADAKDSNRNIPYFNTIDTGLTREEWFSDDQTQVDAYITCLKKLATINQLPETDVDQIVDMMKAIAQVSLKTEEQYDIKKTYNLYQVSDLKELLNNQLSIEDFCRIYDLSASDHIVINDVNALKESIKYLKADNLNLLKSYMKLLIYKDLAYYVDIDSYNITQEYIATVTGQIKPTELQRDVSETVQDMLGFECGKLYCEEYFPEQAKQDISKLVDQIISVYKQRIQALDWMSDTTKTEAYKKLDSMDVRIGYPDQWPQDKYQFTLTPAKDGGLYVNNIIAILTAKQDYIFQTKSDPVDRSQWPDTPQTVNAYYDPSNNSISLLAGILQAPFYDKDATAEENLGGIGMIIAHEITHAFDTAGAQYDEKGNVRNWWTDADFNQFNKLAQKVIDYYNTFKVNGINVNGEQTVTENIADLGAINCVTEIAQKNGYDLQKVYEAYTNTLASKMRDEYAEYLLKVDVHSPSEVRVNAVLSTMEPFYEVYSIQSGDGMYQKPEDRPSIW